MKCHGHVLGSTWALRASTQRRPAFSDPRSLAASDLRQTLHHFQLCDVYSSTSVIGRSSFASVRGQERTCASKHYSDRTLPDTRSRAGPSPSGVVLIVKGKCENSVELMTAYAFPVYLKLGRVLLSQVKTQGATLSLSCQLARISRFGL